MRHLHPWDRRARAEGLRSYPLEDVLRALGYRRDPEDDARWRHPESVVSINGFMFYDHLCGEWGAGAVDLAVHGLGCSVPDALAFLSEMQERSRRTALRPCPPAPSQCQWRAVERYLVDRRGLSPVLIALCRDLGAARQTRCGAHLVCRAAAWRRAPLDNLIGWTPQLREENLPLVVHNPRFLILPWTAYAHGSGSESLPPDVEVGVRAGERVECSLHVLADGATT